MTQLNIAIPPSLESWVNTRLAQGHYTDAADYVRDLVRRDQENAEDDLAWLKAQINYGLQSGVIDKEPQEVLEDIIAERRQRNG